MGSIASTTGSGKIAAVTTPERLALVLATPPPPAVTRFHVSRPGALYEEASFLAVRLTLTRFSTCSSV